MYGLHLEALLIGFQRNEPRSAFVMLPSVEKILGGKTIIVDNLNFRVDGECI